MYLKLDSAAIVLRALICLDAALERWPHERQLQAVVEGSDNSLEKQIVGFINLSGKLG